MPVVYDAGERPPFPSIRVRRKPVILVRHTRAVLVLVSFFSATGAAAACVATSTTVCLLGDRFRVSVDYVNPFSDPPNQPGSFLAARLQQGQQNPDTALFGFGSAQAVEVVVRLQDARPFAPRFDVYYGGMTDVGYTVTVSDTQTGTTRQYTNSVGTVGGGVDRSSFPAAALGFPEGLFTSGGNASFPAGEAPAPSRKTPPRLLTIEPGAIPRVVSHGGSGGANCVEHEPNDSIWEAEILTSGRPCTGGASTADAFDYTIDWEDAAPGRIHDVYELTTESNGRLDVTLTFTKAGADLDVILFDLDGNFDLVILAQATTASMTEHFTSAMYGRGTFYIGVSAYAGSSPYTLTVTALPATAPAAPSNLQAEAISASEVRLTWIDNATDESSFVAQRKQGALSEFSDVDLPISPNSTSVVIPYLEPNTTATWRIRARNSGGFSAPSNEVTTTTWSLTGCTADATTVCLLQGRFRVKIDYVNPFSNPPDQPGTFLAERLLEGSQNPDTALFGFSSAKAVEVVVRVQDTRPFAERFDVYYGGMTDVGYTVTVTDMQTGTTRQYTNTAGTVGGGVDRTSFPAQ